MARFLPAGSPVWREIAPRARWSQTDWILADLVDEVRAFAWSLKSMLVGRRLTKPDPYPRPTDTPKARGGFKPTDTFASAAEFTAWRASRLKH